MFPERFDYYRATTVGEALDHLDGDDDVAVLAGGHSLVPAMKTEGRSPDAVVDLEIDDLDAVTVEDDRVTIGALTTYADAASDERVRERAPLVAAAASEVGDRQIRNCGTLGGNLAEAHPAADPPAAVLAADATIRVRGREGEREIHATEFFLGDGETAVADGELVTALDVPDRRDVGTAYIRKTHPATGYAMVGVAAAVDVADSVVSAARVAATGVVDRAIRLPAVEDALTGSAADLGTVERAASEAAKAVEAERVRSDSQASSDFRTHLLETHVEAAVTDAVERATAASGGDDA